MKGGWVEKGSLQAAAQQRAQTSRGCFEPRPLLVLFLLPGFFSLLTVHFSENQYKRKKTFKKPFFKQERS